MSAADARPATISLALVQEGERLMRICNACRYCEGLCAVFPAMERRLTFTEPDLNYLANLCHNCGECLSACQYAPPHEFGVDIPKTLSEIRRATYRKYAWPGRFAGLFQRHRLTLLSSAIGGPLLLLLFFAMILDPSVLFSSHPDAEGAFYRVMPHGVMVWVFGIAGLAAALALVAGPVAFWRDMGAPGTFWQPRALRQALADALTLRYLDGGGEACAFSDAAPAGARRWFHHLTFYGFLLCFAATTVAAFYHVVLGWHAPYALLSAPVVLGSLGGAGLIVGPAGLLWLKIVGTSDAYDRAQAGMDATFIVLLLLTSGTGFLVLGLRESAALGVIVAVHLGIVLGLFLTIPYGKFVHGTYRLVALVRTAIEQARATGTAPGHA